MDIKEIKEMKGAFWKDLKRDMASGQQVCYISEDDGCQVIFLLVNGKYHIFIDSFLSWESTNDMKAKNEMIETIKIYRLIRI